MMKKDGIQVMEEMMKKFMQEQQQSLLQMEQFAQLIEQFNGAIRQLEAKFNMNKLNEATKQALARMETIKQYDEAKMIRYLDEKFAAQQEVALSDDVLQKLEQLLAQQQVAQPAMMAQQMPMMMPPMYPQPYPQPMYGQEMMMRQMMETLTKLDQRLQLLEQK